MDRLTPEPVTGDPKSLTLLDRNARYMTHEQFQRLVENVRRDGCLTSTPLVWNDTKSKKRVVLSGNHRVKAAVEVGLAEIVWLEVKGRLPRSRRLAMQLSHNAIAGQDDPDMLRALYDELSEVEERAYSGLDDKELGLLDDVDTAGLSEANLDFTHVQLMFLPAEAEKVSEALQAAAEAVRPDERWAARLDDHVEFLELLATAGAAHGVSNTAVGLRILVDVLEAHLTDLAAGWFDPDTGTARHDGWVPWETLTGSRNLPAEAAVVVQQAMEKAARESDLPDDNRWRAIELICGDYLAGQ